ncbi:MAG: VWA domain-containing protein [Peptococcaceae bacterium]|nr:VWA domain-containing protein [Peptococcaceae bacterium]
MNDVLRFARRLRDAGLTVAPSEICDAIGGLTCFPTGTEDFNHYLVLRAALVKRIEDQPVFDTVYQLFFCNQVPTLLTPGIAEVRSSFGHGFKATGLSTLAAAMLDGEFAPCQASLGDAVQRQCQENVPIEESIRRVLVDLNYFGAVNSLRLSKERGILPEWAYQAAQENANRFVRTVQNSVLLRFSEQGLDWKDIGQYLDWRQKSFNIMTAAEISLVKSYLAKIGHKLAVRLGSKRKQSQTGTIDMPLTLRQAMARGAIVSEIVYSRRIPNKPELVLLCDISNSVYLFTGFMLQLVTVLKQKFERVRVFVFVDTIWEIPPGLFNYDMQTTLENIREHNKCSRSGLSDFGRVFSQFASEVLPQLTPKTTLMVLGDARNNWRPPEVPSFRQICAGVKRTYWLNPLAQAEWGKDDCIIKQYAPYCKGVFACSCLAQLEQVARKIL